MTLEERVAWLEATLEEIRDRGGTDFGGQVVVVVNDKRIGLHAYIEHALEVSRS
ncbi:MAG: hypothetical protein K0S82_1787 [Gaiellaceae bacterium]|jgi:hypothetical protein|nr:hypothetical protein [Gaiellaceae bacterium]